MNILKFPTIFFVLQIFFTHFSSSEEEVSTVDDQSKLTDYTLSDFTEPGNVSIETTTTIDDNEDYVENNFTERVRYDGYHIFNVVTVNSKHRKKIRDLEDRALVERLATYPTRVHILVGKEQIQFVKELLTNYSMKYNILSEDLQKLIDNENPDLPDEEYSTRKGHKVTFSHYHRMADIDTFLEYLSSTRSEFVTLHDIGTSVEGKSLKVLKISSGKQNATSMWIDGGIHAREWITVASVLYIINEMVENRDKLDKELQNIDFHFLPLINPDGYEFSHQQERLWRKNRQHNYGQFCIGVDLNRNYGYEWGGQGAGRFACQETYAGPTAFSEPETRAVQKYIKEKPGGFRGSISFHSYGQYILYPWGYAKKRTSDHADLERVGRIAAAAMKQAGGSTYTVGNSATLLYAASGGSDDWAKGVAKIKYTYTIELRDTGRYGFVLPSSEIIPTAKEAYAAVKAVAKELDS